jgi:hypothetical protein
MGIIIKELYECQPICNECGVACCWSIELEEYENYKEFWDNWTCKWCNPKYKGAYGRFKIEHQLFESR